MTIWVVDNRVRQRGIKASMTQKLIQTLRSLSRTDIQTDVQIVSTTNDARRIRGGVVVLSGSSLSIASGNVERAHAAITAVTIALGQGIPILGICFGFQLLAFMYGMQVEKLSAGIRGERHVVGYGTVYINHQDAVKIGDDVLSDKIFAAHVHGVQFHPEATHDGKAWLHRWLQCHLLNVKN